MKHPMTVLLFCLATSAAASSPTKGDFALLTGTYSVAGQNIPLSWKTTVTSVNARKKEYTTVFEITNGGQVQSDTQTNDFEDFQQIETVKDCAEAGTMEPVTVAAGTFSACKFTMNSPGSEHTAYLSSQVPFGMVKIFQRLGEVAVISLELSDFKIQN